MTQTSNVKLKEYIEKILDEREKLQKIIIGNQQRALKLSTKNLEHRLNALNELREEVTRDREKYMTKENHISDYKILDNRIREHYETTHLILDNRIRNLELWISKSIGIGIVVVIIIGFVSGMVGYFIR